MFFNLSGKSLISFIILAKSAKVGQSNFSFHLLNVLPPNQLGKIANTLAIPYNILQISITITKTAEIISVKTNAKIFQEKRDLCVKLLQLQKDIEIFAPEGAFYLFPSCRNFFGKKTPAGEVITNDNDFAKYLLEYAQVAVVPGIAFGAEGFFRLSYATSFELLENGCKQIVKACDLLS
jgi:aspartate aminotransferase